MVVLFVIITFVIALSIEMVYAKYRDKSKDTLISDFQIFNRSSLYAPADYLLSEFHTWVQKNGDSVKVGIDNFAVKSLGNIFIKNILGAGRKIKKGDVIIDAEVHGQKISFRSPISGIIKEVNNLLFDRKIEDAYGKDWGLVIEKDKTDLSLMTETQSHYWLKKEFRRFKDFLSMNASAPEAVGVTMYDGGNIKSGVLSSLSNEAIKDFEEQFLTGQYND